MAGPKHLVDRVQHGVVAMLVLAAVAFSLVQTDKGPGPFSRANHGYGYGYGYGYGPGLGLQGEFRALPPGRILDTRNGTGRSGVTTPLGPGATIVVNVEGQGGVPSFGACGVALNVTSTEADTPSFLTVFPTGQSPRPFVSNLNTEPGQDVPNLVKARLGGQGQVSIFNNNGSTHVVADVVGYFTCTGAAQRGARFTGLPPGRILETRAEGNTGARVGKLGRGETLNLSVLGRGGVPPSNVSAVVLNVTSTEADTPSFLTVFPTGQSPRPFASNLNTEVNQDVPNLTVARLGNDGQVSIFNNNGSTHVVADVVGYFGPEDGSAITGAVFTGVNPDRVFDTRTGNGGVMGKLGPGQSVAVPVLGRGGVPLVGVDSVVLNVTSTEATSPSFLTVFPTGQTRPFASNLNTEVNQDVPNLAVAKVGDGGRVTVYNNAGFTHVVFDVVGYYGLLPTP